MGTDSHTQTDTQTGTRGEKVAIILLTALENKQYVNAKHHTALQVYGMISHMHVA